MVQIQLFPAELQKLDVLIGAVLQETALLPRLLAHDAELYREYGIAAHTRQRLQNIKAHCLRDYCQQIHAQSPLRQTDDSF